MSRRSIIIYSAIAGAIIGSGLGIAGLGSAMNGAIPCTIIAVIIAFLYTRPTPEGMPTPIEEVQQHVVPVVLRGLSLCWNVLMRALITLHVMPRFVRHPWLFIVLIIALMAVLPISAVFFAAIGLVAVHYNVRAEQNFLITLPAKPEA